MEKRIYIDKWLELKPYKEITKTDSYYLKICNKVKQAILTANQSFTSQIFIEKNEIDYLACFLTSYLEDIVSGTNIWNTFVKIHQRLYKKPLPFYRIDEYYEEEINPQDISFLIWYFLNTVQEEKFIPPFKEYIIETTKNAMEVLDEAWEYAPENEYLKSFYQLDDNETNYYVARNLIDVLLFNSYLFYPDTMLNLRDQELNIIEEAKDEDKSTISSLLKDNRDNTVNSSYTRLLGLSGKEWAAEILGVKHPLYTDFLNISQKINGSFLYKGQDTKDIFLEHIASGKKFRLTKKSFDHSETLKEVDTILFMGIVQWKDEWWFSGIFFQHPFDPDLILDEKNSLESRRNVNFLDHKKQEMAKLLTQQFEAFKEFNKGSQIAFLAKEKIEEFYKSYIEFFNNSLNLSKKKKEEARKRARKSGFFGMEEKDSNFPEISETGLVFFNPHSGIEIASQVNSAFPMVNNPYFDINNSEDSILLLLMSEDISAELVRYCIDNCKTKLPFFNQGIGKYYLQDIDFLLRFWKRKNYYSKPLITFTGVKEK